MLQSITRKTDMRLYDLEDIGPHYATTLKMWRGELLCQYRTSASTRLLRRIY